MENWQLTTTTYTLPSVGARVGWRGEILEEIILHGGDGGDWERFAAGGGGDYGQKLEFGEGSARDVDALGVRADVGWREMEAVVSWMRSSMRVMSIGARPSS